MTQTENISDHPAFAALSPEARATVVRNAQASADFNMRIVAWLDALNRNYQATGRDNGVHFEQQAPGGRYSRIVLVDGGKARSVHAFLDVRTGDVYKAAGWKAPAKHVRFNLLDDGSFADLMEVCDWTGRYLYLR